MPRILRPIRTRSGIAALAVATVLAGGLWIDLSEKDDSAPPVEVRRVSDTEDETIRVSREILNVAGVKGKMTEPGPFTGKCAGRDPEKNYRIIYFWSIWDAPIQDLKQGMENLREKLPGKGWNIRSYGPDTSKSRSLELIADFGRKKFTVMIHLYDESKNPAPKAPESIISVALSSACYQVPEGETV
ncbi:hypothetical protein AAHZ94_32605 [Streptomyces sp. HSW2009]|uniref:hypothetical protein n=1 Tax=Streptomyces sp. HSW2009 TaxID=3142890 RepID=UPI0032ECEEA4